MDGLPPGLMHPPIDKMPSSSPPNVLRTFLDSRVRSWGTAPERLTAVAVVGLWTLFMVNVALGAWLLAVRTGAVVCAGLVGILVTLGGHPTLTLALSSVCVGALVVAMPLTRGFTQSGGPPLVLVSVAGLAGATAMAGVVAVAIAVALCLAVALGVLFVVIDRL